MTDRELMQQALEALNKCQDWPGAYEECSRAITALRAAIEQAQEPVAWMYHGIRHDDTPHERPSLIWRPEYMDVMSAEKGAKATPLYAAPRQWQGLTDEDVDEVERWVEFKEDGSGRIPTQKLVRYIERKLKEKNNAG